MHGVICQGMQRALEISLIDLTKKGGFFAKQDHIAGSWFRWVEAFTGRFLTDAFG